MYLRQIQVLNHRSFLNAGPVEILPGVNVVVGPNSSGKTALLDVLRKDVEDEPHRGVETVPDMDGNVLSKTSYVLDVEVEARTLESILKHGGKFGLPIDRDTVNSPHLNDLATAKLRRLLEPGLRRFRSQFEVQSERPGLFPRICDPAFDDENCRRVAVMSFAPERGTWVCEGHKSRGSVSDIASDVFAELRHRTFRVAAERFAVGQGRAGTNDSLAPNAANLPECLNVLQARRTQMDRLIELVRSVLPNITHIAARPTAADQVKIYVWDGIPVSRHDLAKPLDRCGTGVGQVIALLYLLVTASRPRLILLDEPQSFLHPGAIRALMDIVRAHSQHQYIIATHSPAVIGASFCDSIIRVEKSRLGVSSLSRVGASDVRSARATLDHLGASFESLFGARGVIWVEGPTEREVLPAIVQAAGVTKAYGLVFAPLASTGDVVGRNINKVRLASQVHESVAASGGLLPECPGVILDRECTVATEQERIRSRSTLKVTFTKRRAFENYLIDVDAIAVALSSSAGRVVQSNAVETWLSTHANDVRWASGLDRSTDEPGWIANVDAATMLAVMWPELGGSGCAYEKTTHSVQIALELLKRGPAAFQDYVDLVVSLVV